MANQHGTVISEELGLGDHVAYFFKSNAERLAFVIPYIVKGLRSNERCVYVADENSAPHILDEFVWAGIDVPEAIASGRLSVLTKDGSYLHHGIFEPERMISDLDRDVRRALQSGYSGMRITGEMSWALDLPSALVRLCEYEEELRRRWPNLLAGLCQYDESLFPTDIVEKMATCHSVVVRDGRVTRHHTHKLAELA